MDKIRIIIVDDDLAWIKAMTGFINMYEDLIVIASATNKEDAVNLAKTVNPDVILMDLNLSENKRDGIYTSLRILEFSRAKIIMLTSYMDEDIIKDSFSARAVNYISKENYTEVPAAIRNACKSISPMEVLVNDYINLKKEICLKELTHSERKIFNLIKDGYSRSDIEKKLYISNNTVKVQIRNILKKLNAKDTREALKKADSLGLLEEE